MLAGILEARLKVVQHRLVRVARQIAVERILGARVLSGEIPNRIDRCVALDIDQGDAVEGEEIQLLLVRRDLGAGRRREGVGGRVAELDQCRSGLLPEERGRGRISKRLSLLEGICPLTTMNRIWPWPSTLPFSTRHRSMAPGRIVMVAGFWSPFTAGLAFPPILGIWESAIEILASRP